MKGGYPRKPKLSKDGKAAMRDLIDQSYVDIQARCRNVRKNTPYHWTLFFNNGRRLELYPSNMGLHGNGLRYYRTIDELLTEIERWEAMQPEENMELIEDE